MSNVIFLNFNNISIPKHTPNGDYVSNNRESNLKYSGTSYRKLINQYGTFKMGIE